ncbi:hypothetical protein DPV78_010822 [Talaromyces pinophilus]|nr:hypothetical protein DPV78_010822 [Talaromyces pinophilus]
MALKITLYTAHHCPFAHRVQIALRELDLAFETIIVDITIPRTPEYLAVNPRGLVPALVYNGQVLTESGLIAKFLIDSHHPTHLLKSSSDSEGAMQRYKIELFVDTYFTKVHTFFDEAVYSTTSEETEAAANGYIDAVLKNIEALLEDAGPYFGGSSRLTLAEVQTGSFLLRVLTLPNYDDILPCFILEVLQTKAPNFWKWANAVVAEKTVTCVWDEIDVVKRTIARIQGNKKQ